MPDLSKLTKHICRTRIKHKHLKIIIPCHTNLCFCHVSWKHNDGGIPVPLVSLPTWVPTAHPVESIRDFPENLYCARHTNPYPPFQKRRLLPAPRAEGYMSAGDKASFIFIRQDDTKFVSKMTFGGNICIFFYLCGIHSAFLVSIPLFIASYSPFVITVIISITLISL